jgi:DNA-directed RNA polymerase specialized sigma24 family protein
MRPSRDGYPRGARLFTNGGAAFAGRLGFEGEMDESEFEDWYLLHHARLVNSLYLVCGNSDLAREATDEAFAQAVSRWSQVREMESPIGWTYKVALNRLRHNAKRQRRESVLWHKRVSSDRPVPLSGHPEVWDAVSALPPMQRTAIVLRYVADRPEAEIADILSVSRSTVASNLTRARAALAEMLGEQRQSEMDRD